jgi:D-tyrosyl-tRNA(Tyr) deacylase
MKALVQRVSQAQVKVNNQVIGKISGGILAFIGVEKNDSKENADRLLQKIVNYRIFSDAQGKMNLSLLDTQSELLLVSQFTLVANTQKGLRPSFSSAGNPELSEHLYNYLIEQAKELGITVQTGAFAADMKVSLINDGPVTFNLQS